MAGNTATKREGFMNCEEVAEFVSALCDGATIPREVAGHIGGCQACRARLNAYADMGVELKRIASLEPPATMKARSWEKEQRIRMKWWQGGRATMKIPRFAFASMLALILLLSSSLVLVRARTNVGGPVLVLSYRILPDGNTVRCVITTDGNSSTNHCSDSNSGTWGLLTLNIRFVSKDGGRTQLGVRTRYESQILQPKQGNTDDLKDVPEKIVSIGPGEKQQIFVSGLGEIELTGEYLDHMPALRYGPDESLDPRKSEFRIISPVLVRGKEIVLNLVGSSSIDSGDQDATLMIYNPGEGRYLISTIPFEGAVEGSVQLGQIKFNLEGHDYLLLTAMPTTRSEHVWVAHDPQYNLSEHMQGAPDDQPMFMVRSLNRLLQQRIQH
ncbi:MAG TPA: hypothetical protein VGH83_08205 [Candidatus Acidoferrum sp.]|jgi:hypothetical protein